MASDDEIDHWLLQDEYKSQSPEERRNSSPAPSPTGFGSSPYDRYRYSGFGSSAVKRRQRDPDQFEGKTPWNLYWAHFQAVWKLNKWQPEEAADQLAAVLTGGACHVFNPPVFDGDGRERALTIMELVDRLEKRYGPGELAESYLLQLKQRRRKPRETLRELAEAIQELIPRAYPEASTAFGDRMAVTHFKDALTESETRAAVHRARPKTLEEAVLAAMEMESFLKLEEQRERPRYVRRAEGDGDNSEMKQRLEKLEKSQEELLQLVKTLSVAATDRATARPQPERRRKCYECGSEDHLVRSCPHYRYQGNEGWSAPRSRRWPNQRPPTAPPQRSSFTQPHPQTTPHPQTQTQPRV